MYDVDGNMYYDWSLSSGPCILGQHSPIVINAIKEQNAILMAQLEEMKKMIMIQTKTPVEEKEIKEPVVPEEKNGGRQPKKK